MVAGEYHWRDAGTNGYTVGEWVHVPAHMGTFRR